MEFTICSRPELATIKLPSRPHRNRTDPHRFWKLAVRILTSENHTSVRKARFFNVLLRVPLYPEADYGNRFSTTPKSMER